MSGNFWLVLVLGVSLFVDPRLWARDHIPPISKKKILILSESGGGGHIAASQGIQEVLGDQYDVTEFLPLEGFPGHEQYNFYAKNGNYLELGLLNRMQYLSEILMTSAGVPDRLSAELERVNPQLVISVFPVANQMSFLEASKRGVPFLVLPLDFESRHYVHFVHSPGPTFKFGLLFDDPDLKRKIKTKLSDENLVVMGAPLRKDFLRSDEDLAGPMQAIRAQLGAGETDKIVIVMMGAQGMGESVVTYSRRILEFPGAIHGVLHVAALCGNNLELKQKVESMNERSDLKRNPKVRVHALETLGSEKMAALMRTSQVLVSKPGGATINEAATSGLYVLFDTSMLFALPWEGGNLVFAQKQGWGEKISNRQFDWQLRQALRRKRMNIDIPSRSFKENLRRTVAEMIG